MALSAQPKGTEHFVGEAFRMRQLAVQSGDQPYGAVVVKDGRIVGEGVSAVVTGTDPTAHAEMQAIRDAARRLGTTDLSGCELYGTSRACAMCEAAAVFARISRMYYGSGPTDAGPPRLPTRAVSQREETVGTALESIAGASTEQRPSLIPTP
jgi:tRNA(Arg) A34 adenosine deaminase TadA